MKPGIPWSVKGIEPDAREAAKNAARRSGMTLGEWLNAAIVEQAEPEPASQHQTPPAAIPKQTRSKISTHPIERAATRLEDIADKERCFMADIRRPNVRPYHHERAGYL